MHENVICLGLAHPASNEGAASDATISMVRIIELSLQQSAEAPNEKPPPHAERRPAVSDKNSACANAVEAV
jgi:hypothetical protein